MYGSNVFVFVSFVFVFIFVYVFVILRKLTQSTSVPGLSSIPVARVFRYILSSSSRSPDMTVRHFSLQRRRTVRIFSSMSGPTPRRRHPVVKLISDEVDTSSDLKFEDFFRYEILLSDSVFGFG